MTDGEELAVRIDALREQLHQVYRVRGRDLGQALRRARRFLPRHIRKQGAQLAEAEPSLGNPALERLMDFEALHQSCEAVRAHLESIDVADIRRGRFLAMAGLLSFYVFFVAACFVIWMRWAGQL